MQLQNKGKKLENARVLTSSEFLHELEEKERLKAEKETQKQLRKRQREEKKAQKTGAKRALQTKRMGQKVLFSICLHAFTYCLRNLTFFHWTCQHYK